MSDADPRLFDLTELRQTACGDENFVNEMIALFITQNEETIKGCYSSFARNNIKEIKSIIHKLKPSMIILGVISAHQIVLEIEKTNLLHPDLEVLKKQLDSLSAILEKVNVQLKQI